MPLTKKETNLMNSMRARYGREKGEKVFYASAQMGKFGRKMKEKHFKKRGGVDGKANE